MSLFQKLIKKRSSRPQIALEGIRDGVLALPHRQYRLLLEVSSINFELKSEEEQDNLIDMYQSFLNALPCPLQLLIRVREVDIDNYLEGFAVQAAAEPEQRYKDQITEYGTFVRSLVSTNRILARHFYVVLSYTGETTSDERLIREQLQLSADIVAKGLGKLGIKARTLDSLEVLDLFYSFYNPELAKLQPLTRQTLQLLKESYV